MADELYLLAIGWISVRETWSQVPYYWLIGLIYSYTYVSVVLTSDISDITISKSTRTEDFDNLVLVLMLMSQLSSLRHKIRYAYVVVRTRHNSSIESMSHELCLTREKTPVTLNINLSQNFTFQKNFKT